MKQRELHEALSITGILRREIETIEKNQMEISVLKIKISEI